ANYSGAAIVERRLSRSKRTLNRRHVDVVLSGILRNRRQHANYHMRAIVHAECLTNYAWITTETVLPVLVTENNDCLSSCLFVVGGEGPAEDWLRTQHVKEVRRNHARLDSLRFRSPVKNEIHRVILDYRFHRVILIAIFVHFFD